MYRLLKRFYQVLIMKDTTYYLSSNECIKCNHYNAIVDEILFVQS